MAKLAQARAPLPSLEPPEAVELYRAAIATLLELGVPFMVGGGYAFRHFTGIERYTKDLDLFVRPRDACAVLGALAPIGAGAEMVFPHWLGKVYGEHDAFIDVVFSSGNGIAVIDDEWLAHATAGLVLGLAAPICPAEETIWSKAFVAERERYDGADIAHIIRARGEALDWRRIVRRFGTHWRVLLGHLVLYGYIYPGDRDRVPAWVLSALMRRLSGELGGVPEETLVCRGTLLSRAQYLPDVDGFGYRDARLEEAAHMTPADIALWTSAIGQERPPSREGPRGNRRHR